MSALFEDELVELRKEVEHLREERTRLDAEIFRLHRQSDLYLGMMREQRLEVNRLRALVASEISVKASLPPT